MRGAGKIAQLEGVPSTDTDGNLTFNHTTTYVKDVERGLPLLPRYPTATAPASRSSRARPNEPEQGGFNYNDE